MFEQRLHRVRANPHHRPERYELVRHDGGAERDVPLPGASPQSDRVVDLGFGQPTSASYPGQAAGLLRRPEDWSGRSKPTLAIGQEIAVTPLQLGLAVCAVANGGIDMAVRRAASAG